MNQIVAQFASNLSLGFIWCLNDVLFFFYLGNISGANQPLRANYGNFNLGHNFLSCG